MRTFLFLFMLGFMALCGLMIADTGLFVNCDRPNGCILLQKATDDEIIRDTPVDPTDGGALLEARVPVGLRATGGTEQSFTLGSTDPKSGFKFQFYLNSKGAAIETATYSEFNDRDPQDPQPLQILSPASGNIFSFANKLFAMVNQNKGFDLDVLPWKTSGVVDVNDDGSRSAEFEAIIETDNAEPVVKLIKTYTIRPGSYLIDCDIKIENLSQEEQRFYFDISGPVGIPREGIRRDERRVVGGFRDPKEQVVGARLEITKFDNNKTYEEKPLTVDNGHFLWAAVADKYFTAILVPVPTGEKDYCDWIREKTGRFYNPDGQKKTEDENIGVHLQTVKATLSPVESEGSQKTYNFQMYLGPKDKSIFDKDLLYKKLGFVQTIDFMACCCPAAIIRPLAFGILALMKWMHGFIGNYGVVIIILVFFFRLVIHPLTKKSQISMSKMGKMAPKIEEIKKKYANNKAELQKQMMVVYKEQGASPIMGMLPMMVQMPIWISLWSSINTSIDLRGAAFLPFWITDLSLPDALWTFPTVIIVPFVGWKITSLNLLPLMMGVAFYMQQKLMPKQAAASPQVAQQQKMMMIMMPLMFPLMLYNAPSGVNLYIMASTFAGVIEQVIIRKHIREKEEEEERGLVSATSKTGGKVKKKKPKPFYRNY